MSNKELAKLVEQVMEDRNKYFEQLFSAAWDTVYYLSLFMLGNEQDAEDISQDVFIKIHQNFSQLKQPIAFNRWMNRIVMNTCNTALSKRSKIAANIELSACGEDYEIIGFIEEDNTDFLPSALAEQKENRAIVANLVETLPEKQKEAVLMFYYEDLSTEQMARILNCSVNVIHHRLRNARQSLKSKFEHWHMV